MMLDLVGVKKERPSDGGHAVFTLPHMLPPDAPQRKTADGAPLFNPNWRQSHDSGINADFMAAVVDRVLTNHKVSFIATSE